MRHYLNSDLNRILQNSLLFLPSLFRSHPTFPLINLEFIIVSHSLLFVFNAETVL